MSITSILGGEEIAESAFRRTENGWIFKTPLLHGLFGLGAFYRVDDAQKADLTRLYLNYWRASMLGVMPLVLLLMVLQNHFTSLAKGYDLPLVIALGLLLGVTVLVWFSMQLKRRLAGLAPTVENFTLVDQYKSVAQRTPLWRAVTFEVLSLLLLAGAFLPQKEQVLSKPMQIAGIALFGFCALYFGYAIVARLMDRSRTA